MLLRAGRRERAKPRWIDIPAGSIFRLSPRSRASSGTPLPAKSARVMSQMTLLGSFHEYKNHAVSLFQIVIPLFCVFEFSKGPIVKVLISCSDDCGVSYV
jgi:hypothetical protein